MTVEDYYEIAARAARGLPRSAWEDLIQIGVARLAQVEPDNSGYAYVIARHAMLTELKRGRIDGFKRWDKRLKKLRPLFLENEDSLGEIPDPAKQPDEILARKDDVEQALAQLGPKDRDLVTRYFGIGCEERSAQELADELGVSDKRVFQRLTAIYKKLKLILE
jgi:RNA polymerase sigma factor (sigma-70 family)